MPPNHQVTWHSSPVRGEFTFHIPFIRRDYGISGGIWVMTTEWAAFIYLWQRGEKIIWWKRIKRIGTENALKLDFAFGLSLSCRPLACVSYLLRPRFGSLALLSHPQTWRFVLQQFFFFYLFNFFFFANWSFSIYSFLKKSLCLHIMINKFHTAENNYSLGINISWLRRFNIKLIRIDTTP